MNEKKIKYNSKEATVEEAIENLFQNMNIVIKNQNDMARVLAVFDRVVSKLMEKCELDIDEKTGEIIDKNRVVTPAGLIIPK